MIPGRFLATLPLCNADSAMRIVVSVFAITFVLIGCFRSTLGDDPGSKQSPAVTESTRQYVIECRIASDNPKELSFAVPKVTVRDGVKASVSDTSQRPITVAVKTEGRIDTPVTQTITEGTTIEMTVRSHGDDKAILDLSVELCGANEAPCENGRSVRMSFAKGRVIECVSLGKKVKAPMHGWNVEIVVNAVSNDETVSVPAPEFPAKTETSVQTAAKGTWRLFSRANRQR